MDAIAGAKLKKRTTVNKFKLLFTCLYLCLWTNIPLINAIKRD